MTRARLSLGALLLVLLAAGPGPAQGQTAGELRVALPWTPENLDPTMNLSSIRAKVGVSLFDSLVSRDADNRIVPQLAESWKALDDLTWQLKLRRGVVFHNGSRSTPRRCGSRSSACSIPIRSRPTGPMSVRSPAWTCWMSTR